MTSIEIYSTKNKIFGSLSNNFKSFTNINGITWSSVSNYIYTEALPSVIEYNKMKKADPENIHSNYLKFKNKAEDDLLSVALLEALRVKFQNPKMMEILLSTGYSPIIYQSDNKFLGDGRDRKGKNKLGNFMVQIRNEVLNKNKREKELFERTENIYKAYLAKYALKFAFNEGDDLKSYFGLNFDEIINKYGRQELLKHVPPKTIILDLYNNPYHDNKIINLSISYPNVLIFDIRKNLQSFSIRQELNLKNKIFIIFIDNLIKNKFPGLDRDFYLVARNQMISSFTSYQDLDTLKNNIYNTSKNFKNPVQKEVIELIMNTYIPTEEEITISSNINIDDINFLENDKKQYIPTSPTYNPRSPTYNPTSPTYNPSSPTYSPSSPTYSPSSPTYNSYGPPGSPPSFMLESSTYEGELYDPDNPGMTENEEGGVQESKSSFNPMDYGDKKFMQELEDYSQNSSDSGSSDSDSEDDKYIEVGDYNIRTKKEFKKWAEKQRKTLKKQKKELIKENAEIELMKGEDKYKDKYKEQEQKLKKEKELRKQREEIGLMKGEDKEKISKNNYEAMIRSVKKEEKGKVVPLYTEKEISEMLKKWKYDPAKEREAKQKYESNIRKLKKYIPTEEEKQEKQEREERKLMKQEDKEKFSKKQYKIYNKDEIKYKGEVVPLYTEEQISDMLKRWTYDPNKFSLSEAIKEIDTLYNLKESEA